MNYFNTINIWDRVNVDQLRRRYVCHDDISGVDHQVTCLRGKRWDAIGFNTMFQELRACRLGWESKQ